MILAMDIVGDGAGYGYKLSARRDWKKKTARHKDFENLGQTDAALALENALFSVEGEHPVHARHVNHGSMTSNGGIAVTSAQTAGDSRPIPGRIEQGR